MDIKHAKYNQNYYNNLSQQDKNKWIEQVYNYYNKSLPLVKYDKNEVNKYFNKLKQPQKYKVIKTNFDYKKYKLFNLINFMNEHDAKLNSDSNNNYFIDIIDVDYKINYIDFCSLSDFYQNNERVKCQVKKYKSPVNYYKDNYKFILNKYFSKMFYHYEKGLKIDKLNFTKCKNCVNPIYLQAIMYENNRFCTVYKPYLFKLLIQIFKTHEKPNILDLSSGWGDRLIAIASIQNDINLYIGIDPNKKLITGYKKIIDDLIKDKNKVKLINDKSENVDFNLLPKQDIIFWSPPFFDQEIYTKDESQSVEQFKTYDDWESKFIIDVINRSTNNLVKNGVLILYIGNINYESFLKKISYIQTLEFIGNLRITSDNKFKNYMIFVKNSSENICEILTEPSKNKNFINKIKTMIKSIKTDNPPFRIENINVNNKKFHVVQDGYLLAGTKMRIADLFVKKMLKENKDIDTLVYGGAPNGFGIVATAYAAYKNNLKCEIFIFGDKDYVINSRQYNSLLLLGAKVYFCGNYKNAANLKYDMAQYICLDGYKDKKNYYIIPMGLNDNDKIMVNLLADQLTKINIKNLNIKRMWLVAGSGGISEALYKALPNTHFFVYVTSMHGKYGKYVLERFKHKKNITILNKFNIDNVTNDANKYYKTVGNYDDLVFPYVKKYGKDGDYIWNVASDELI